jgi:hypothetical protein
MGRTQEHPVLQDWDQLDESLYDPDSEALAFFKKETGIDDDDALKQHVLNVQQEAFSVSCLFFFLHQLYCIARLADAKGAWDRFIIIRVYGYLSLRGSSWRGILPMSKC